MDPEELDATVESLIKRIRSRRSGPRKHKLQKDLQDIVSSFISQSRSERDLLTDFIVNKLVKERYPENIHEYEKNFQEFHFYAKSQPSLRLHGKGRYYLSGDSWILKKIQKGIYLLGRMDGMGHGVSACITVLSAHKFLDDIVNKGIYSPDQIAGSMNELIFQLQGQTTYTTMLLTLLDDREIKITNTGDGGTFLYLPSKNSIDRLATMGRPIGIFSSEEDEANKLYEVLSMKIEPRLTIVSYTDGLFGDLEFDEEPLRENIRVHHKSPKRLAKAIFEYAANYPLPAPDDSTIIVATFK